MNRYALWKYIVIAVVLLVAGIYTLPNFYGESPAVQVSSGKSTVKIDEAVQTRVEAALKDAGLKPNGIFFEQGPTTATPVTPAACTKRPLWKCRRSIRVARSKSPLRACFRRDPWAMR